MFARLATVLSVAALAAVAIAAPNAVEARGGDTCSNEGNYCCNTLSQTTFFPGASLLNVIANVAAGVQCDPISVIGVGGQSCTQQVACCSNSVFNSVVGVSCTPINVNV